jgi:hypothetical protein
VPTKFETAEGRWEGMGPYYAMFPTNFADRVVSRYSTTGAVVLDPFAGRGTTLFSAGTNSRCGIGVEINPVGWVYSSVKLKPAPETLVMKRVFDVWYKRHHYRNQAEDLPRFFKKCFHKHVREFLVTARGQLDWRNSRVDRTLMAFLLVYLHGKRTQALSNQMRQTKSMSPQYALAWWRDNEMRVPNVDPVEFLLDRVRWRYALGVPSVKNSSRAYFGCSTRLVATVAQHLPKKPSLLLTSPPYFGVTNYHYDQWLRLWLLGEEPNALRKPGRHRARFANPAEYQSLLNTVFGACARTMTRDATVYVRTGRQKSTYEPTRLALTRAFPNHRIRAKARPFTKPTQTSLFGDKATKQGEVDLILQPR